MKDYLKALELAESGSLPASIDEHSDPDVSVIRELVEAGYLWAIDATTFSGVAFLNPRITLAGREYVNELRKQSTPQGLDRSTGWPRVDRTAGEIRRRLSEAQIEEQFQAVGLLCREALISLAQAVYDSNKHPPIDGVAPSSTDAKRMLEAYIAVELEGSSHAAARRHAKAANAFAADLQHHRTASFRQAALCVEATLSVIEVIAIVSGHRDPP